MPDNPTEAEVETTTEVEEPTESTETTTEVTRELLNSDDFVKRVGDYVSDSVFSRMQTFTQGLLDASTAAAEAAVAMQPVDQAPPPNPEEAPPPDQAPTRRHRLFAQPLKRRDV